MTAAGADPPTPAALRLTGIPSLEDLVPLAGRRVLVRADLNAPLRPTAADGFEVADDFRLQASRPTLEWLLDQRAVVTVCSHLGRPKGRVDTHYAMAPVREALASMVPGVEVMENLRFNPGEEANDPEFARHLAEGFDCFVNDAFGACHRSHASIVGLPALLPSAAGRLLTREVQALSRVMVDPELTVRRRRRGGEVADKLGVLRALADRVDQLLLGGAMCFTFLAALGHDVGGSHVEPALFDEARSLVASFDEVDLPTDLVARASEGSTGGSPTADTRTFAVDLPPGWQGVDIGPSTRTSFAETIAGARTVLWNGPMGVFEDPALRRGDPGRGRGGRILSGLYGGRRRVARPWPRSAAVPFGRPHRRSVKRRRGDPGVDREGGPPRPCPVTVQPRHPGRLK